MKTVDFLWKTWNLTQPKGKSPQDLDLNETERVDMWVQRLGGCPSYEDYIAFGVNLNKSKFGFESYVGTAMRQDPFTKHNVFDFGELSCDTKKCFGRKISIVNDSSKVCRRLDSLV